MGKGYPFYETVQENIMDCWPKGKKLFKARFLNWSIYFQSSLNYLTSPAISSDDKIIQNKLGGDQNDLSGKTFPVLNSVEVYLFLFRNPQVGQKDCFTL